jgi:hypothetical protein
MTLSETLSSPTNSLPHLPTIDMLVDDDVVGNVRVSDAQKVRLPSSPAAVPIAPVSINDVELDPALAVAEIGPPNVPPSQQSAAASQFNRNSPLS